MGFWVFLVHPTMVLVLLSASVEISFVSRMRDFYIGTADQNWFSVVVVKRSSGCTLQFTSAEILPLHNFQKWDCPCM